MLQLAKIRRGASIQIAVLEDGVIFGLRGSHQLVDFLHAEDPAAAARAALAQSDRLSESEIQFLHPVDEQEIWAAGVTYKRSKIAREEESAGAAHFYDKVYTAERPELFWKATARRVVSPGEPIRVRQDSRWNVPEPEWTLVINPTGKIVGYTIGNDVSSRDIEGENPLYLPQAKVYRGSCALGPMITLATSFPERSQVQIELHIERGGQRLFEGSTTLAMMARTAEDLASWLYRDQDFAYGAFLLTCTGILPPDSFSLATGDVVTIRIDGIGTLINPVG